mgnify:FL=1
MGSIMKKYTLTQFNTVINYIILNPGSTISCISSDTGIHYNKVFEILKRFFERPFGGIFIYYEGYDASMPFSSIRLDILYHVLRWYIDTDMIEKLPVESLTEKERIILNSVNTFLSKNKAQNPRQKYQKDMPVFYAKNPCTQFIKTEYMGYYSQVKRSIIEKRGIKIKYQKGEDIFSFDLCPLGVAYRTEFGFLYVVAQDEDKNIFPYRIDRIRDIQITNKRFKKPDQFSMKSYVEKVWGMDMSKPVKVSIRFKDEANVLFKMANRLMGKGNTKKIDDGSIIFNGYIKGINTFKSWLRGFGSSVEVLKPEWLKEEIILSNKKILKNYQKKFYIDKL